MVLADQPPAPIFIHSMIAFSPEIEKGFVTDFKKLEFHCIFLGRTRNVANEPVTHLHLLEGHSKIESPELTRW